VLRQIWVGYSGGKIKSPALNALTAVFLLRLLTSPDASKVDRIRRIRGVLNILRVIKFRATVVVVVVSCAKWQGKVGYVVHASIFFCGKSLQDALDIMPVKYARRWVGANGN